MPHNNPEAPMRVSLPADVQRPDTIIGSFTTRQVVILGGTGVALWMLWAAANGRIPLAYFLAAAAPLALFGYALATVTRDGISLDRWLLAAMRFRRSPKTLVPVDGPVAAPPAWVATEPKVDVPAPLRLPAKGIRDGLIDLGPDGHAALVGCGTVNLHLRSVPEQNALVAGFARWLHSLDAPAQIVVRSRRISLVPMASTIAAGAAGLRDPQLERAARAHAVFLQRLSTERELLHRQVTVAVRDKRSPVHASHRAGEAAQALAGCEIPTRILDSDAVAAVLGEGFNASVPAGSGSGIVMTAMGEAR